MLYVLRYTVGVGSGRRVGFKAFSTLSDAMRLHQAAEAKVQPKGPLIDCALYETDASGSDAAIEAVKTGGARQLGSGQLRKSDLDEPSLDEMISEMMRSDRLGGS